MIVDSNARRPDVTPGRLKVITIGPRLTVAFANSADPASVAVRNARRAFLESGREAAIEVIKQDSISGLTDYITVSHDPDASVLLTRRGASIPVKDICAIGNDEPFRHAIQEELLAGHDADLFRGTLRHMFMDRLLTQRHVGDGIGGFPIIVSATPHSHQYMMGSAGYDYKLNIIWGQVTEQPWEQVESGDGHYRFIIMPSEQPDVPVVGACLLQARTGYVYSPIEQPEPFPVPLIAHNERWEGREQEMFGVLQAAIEEHVVRVRALS